MLEVNVIGAGLAGSEATYQLIKRGIKVNLYEMRPKKQTEVHRTSLFSELVCSNSFRAKSIANAVGLLKEEMKRLDSIIINAALKNEIPAGGALAVDREGFSKYITDFLSNHPLVNIINEEVTKIPEGPTIIATGPLTSDSLSREIQQFCGSEYLYFYDAVAPIISEASIDKSKVYLKSRYDKGDATYLNCPMTEEEFNLFYDALVYAEKVMPEEYELKVFEGCMAIEDIAARGKRTLLFGPMKPVGLEDPRTGERPYAVVQLRQDDAAKSMYNIVGFQTHLKWGEQKRILRMIPGLENCEILRYGVMHRNTYINSPTVLNKYYQTNKRKDLFFAGQITGVEGYVESAASGLVAGINLYRFVNNLEMVDFTNETGIGALANYISRENRKFVPMNVNFGIFKEPNRRLKKSEKSDYYKFNSDKVLDKLIKEI
ncbi:MAG TPA: methylenetetrahydrofolate--tRNA-(uracil(54)-C(5))-methyltransferase (FADH(2)-oxidizing) TrmFO [Acholeplasmataceae bacterium]|nr:methylenetetrahydrofolate--tRNA-(uracil(54)-C(5))-methyltransferase (FADH(2)-oxidizing) TrmFO [Acholeplasmataceae bacterium]